MARKPSKTLTERELQIMQIIWSLGEARLGQVQEALGREGEPAAPSTVATLLGILVQKGYLTQQGRHGRYVYVPTSTRAEVTRGLLDAFLERVGLGGAPSFLIQLLKAETLSDEDRESLRAILRQADPSPQPPPRNGEGEKSGVEEGPP